MILLALSKASEVFVSKASEMDSRRVEICEARNRASRRALPPCSDVRRMLHRRSITRYGWRHNALASAFAVGKNVRLDGAPIGVAPLAGRMRGDVNGVGDAVLKVDEARSA